MEEEKISISELHDIQEVHLELCYWQCSVVQDRKNIKYRLSNHLFQRKQEHGSWKEHWDSKELF